MRWGRSKAFALDALEGELALHAKLTASSASVPTAPAAAGTGPGDESSGTPTWVWLSALGVRLVALAMVGGADRSAVTKIQQQ